MQKSSWAIESSALLSLSAFVFRLARPPDEPIITSLLAVHPFRSCGLRRFGAFLLIGGQPRHHGAQLLSNFFNRMLLRGFAQLGKFLAAFLIFFNPLLGEFAALDLLQHFLHRLARVLSNYHLAAREVAILGGVRDRIAHAAQAAFIAQI